MQHPKKQNPKIAGVNMIELLCVIAIVAILAALYLPALARAFVRVKKFLSGF
ncbi:MAG TPA: prepilin-type N-terminal cleavage/methylation domain-containing protein [Verrucomicrobiae bacterium]|nr:prepilin-type N-terminal cleavage/methylation domain-containing protein [Verrucomicrobiae bacterium]